MPVEIRKIPVISTAHMFNAFCWDNLKEDNMLTAVHDTEYGHIVHMPLHERNIVWPAWFVPILHWAEKHNYDWIWFDCDAAAVPDLPVFDW